VDTVIVAVIVVTTVYSGIEYFMKNWSVFNFKK
jgi:phosphatidylglycerophosphate synthase